MEKFNHSQGHQKGKKLESSADQGNLHYTAYPFKLADGMAGGLPSVFLRESRIEHSSLNIFSMDLQDFQMGSASVLAAQTEDANLVGEKFTLWFNTGFWQYLHPDAHTSKASSEDALRAMYPKDLVDALKEENEHAAQVEVGSFELMLHYVEKYRSSFRAHHEFNQCS